MDISKIDKNFKVETKIEREGLKFYDIDQPPFKIYGVYRDGEHYVRMPFAVADTINEGTRWAYKNTTGGRVRFVTDSPYIAVHVKVNSPGKMPHFAFTGSIGCDLYSGTRYFGTFVPRIDVTTEFENVVDIADTAEREYTINMPLYSGIDKMYIGIKEGCTLKPADEYEISKPIVYYGSSITHGGCASRPGNAYPNIISRELDCDFINLGFSGSARAEDEIANYIATLDMSVFVYDYEYNAGTFEHYQNTHERMFKIIREKNPDLPIIMVSRPKYYLSPSERRFFEEVLMVTYNKAVAAGDKNVYYIDGKTFFPPEMREMALVDNVHPTDIGFWCMARVIGEKLKEILK